MTIMRPPQQGQGWGVGLPLTAIAAAVIGGVVARLWCGDEFAGAGDVLGTRAAGEEAVVADAVEAMRQDVDEEAADELVGCEGHDLLPFATLGAIVLPLEGDAVAVERNQPAVGDGDAMGVAREAAEGWN
jgi:hypothetical protein